MNPFFREIIKILKADDMGKVPEISQEKLVLPASYAKDTVKFLDDTSSSLHNHNKDLQENVKNMINQFQKSSDIWKAKLNDLNIQADRMVSQRRILHTQMYAFKKNI